MSQVFGKDPKNEPPPGLEKPIELITAVRTVQTSGYGGGLSVPKILPCALHGKEGCRICVPTNVGHGHVFPRPDGVLARCGGPALCGECAKDLTQKVSIQSQAVSLADLRVEGKPVPDPKSAGVLTLEQLVHAGVTPMILKCPVCKGRHIDVPQPEIGWLNPPHRTHLCNHCGHLWRPQEYSTVGVSDDDWLSFMGSIREEDWQAVISLAAANTASETGRVQVQLLEADGFQRICLQMPLYARFITEPTDNVDHIRLWYMTEDGRHMQGDSVPWTTFLENVLRVMKLPDARIKAIIRHLQQDEA